MKKTTTLLLVLISINFSYAQNAGFPNADPAFNQVACDSLDLPFTGGNVQRGNMFDMTATNQITISHIDADLVTTTDMEIYYRPGTYVGHESSSAGWILAGSASGVVPHSPWTPVPININLTMNAGETYGWYVTSTINGANLSMLVGSLIGDPASSDANLAIKQGCSADYPFMGFAPLVRVFLGQVHYCTGTTGINDVNQNTISADVYPNPLTASSKLVIRGLSDFNNYEVQIFNSLGSLISNESILNSNELSLSTSKFSPGLYFYTVRGANNSFSKGRFLVGDIK